jgi:hypothetical protein
VTTKLYVLSLFVSYFGSNYLFQVALADETQRISLPTPLIEEPEDDARELEITAQYQIKPVRKSHHWIGLEVLPSGILSAMSSGLVNLHPFTESGTTHQASVLSPLTCLRTVPTQSASGPSHMVVAGKNVELSMWDMERTFAAGIKAKDGKGEAGAKKRKKNELEEGEIWRAKRVSDDPFIPPRTILTSILSCQTTFYRYRRPSTTLRCVSYQQAAAKRLVPRR